VTEQQSDVLVGGLTKDNLLAEVNMGAMVLHEKLMSTLGRADALALSFASIKREQKLGNIGTDEVRSLVNAVLKRRLTDNPGELGITAAWEPGTLDSGGDAMLSESGDDQHGRFVPYWSRGRGGLSMEPLVGYEDSNLSESGDRVGEYYLCPRDTGHACVLNPFKYSVQGKAILLTTLAAPISVDNQFNGIVGIDVSVDFLNELAADISQRVFKGRNQVFQCGNRSRSSGRTWPRVCRSGRLGALSCPAYSGIDRRDPSDDRKAANRYQSAVKVMQTSQQQAIAGVEQAQKTSQALEQILVAIDNINDLNIQVASAADQQSAVTADISQGAQSSGELARISTNLTSQMNKFTV